VPRDDDEELDADRNYRHALERLEHSHGQHVRPVPHTRLARNLGVHAAAILTCFLTT
jgi:hypothetical protein